MKPAVNNRLTFESLHLNLKKKATNCSLYPLLFPGGAAKPQKEYFDAACDEPIDKNRLALITKIHAELRTRKAAGAPDPTIANLFYGVRRYFQWLDENKRQPALGSLNSDFLAYAEHLLYRSDVRNEITYGSAYTMVQSLASLVNGVLELTTSVMLQSCFRGGSRGAPWSDEADDGVPEKARQFGKALLSVSETMTIDFICRPYPLELSPLPGLDILIGRSGHGRAIPIKDALGRHRHLLLRERSAAINFRVEAEMLLFISQTGMNLEQTRRLQISDFHYSKSKTKPNCLNVARSYKARRGGEVAFEIYSEYKKIFLKYLELRQQLFPDDDGPLFRFIESGKSKKPHYYQLATVAKKFRDAGIPYLTSRALRKVRLNAILDHTKRPEIVAEMAQDSPSVLFKHYIRPSVTRSIREVAAFHRLAEPVVATPSPGACSSLQPSRIAGAPDSSPTPDCRNPAGCMFCVNHRDLDNKDYVWSLLSYRHLKSIELSKHRGADPHLNPAFAVIERISDKIEWFQRNGVERATWVAECVSRIQEGWYHPGWQAIIETAEAII